MIVYDALSRWANYKKWEGTFGVEIETETKHEYAVPEFTFWDVHNDGSLRDFGKEYVLKQPLSFGKSLDDAFEEFKGKTKDIPFKKDSISTSVHVHVNMLNEKFVTMANFITVYTIVENILIRYCGPDRKSSLFCLPICDAEETAKNVRQMFQAFDKKNYKFVHQFSEEQCKYAALNLASLSKIGSLEVRSFRGTPDTEEIRNWVGILNSMLRYARQNITPPDIIKAYHDKAGELLSEIFGEYREQLRYSDETELIKKTFFWATVNAYSVKNWSRMDVEQKAPTKKDFDIEAVSQQIYGRAFDALSLEQQQAVVQELERLATRPFADDFGNELPEQAEVNVPAQGRRARGIDNGAGQVDAARAWFDNNVAPPPQPRGQPLAWNPNPPEPEPFFDEPDEDED